MDHALSFVDGFWREVRHGGADLSHLFYNNTQLPRLRDVRGKIIILKRFDDPNIPGINISNFSDGLHNINVSYSVSDMYTIPKVETNNLMPVPMPRSVSHKKGF